MVSSSSLFSQLLSLIDRVQFQQLVIKHKAEKHAKGYNSWDQFVAPDRGDYLAASSAARKNPLGTDFGNDFRNSSNGHGKRHRTKSERRRSISP